MAYIKINNVPREVAEELKATKHQRKLAALAKDYYSQQIKSAQRGVIDSAPADKGAVRNQEGWISRFNQQRKRMISAPDVYWIGQNGTSELVQSVRDDFENSWLVTSTRETYNPDTLDARITHNHGSTVVQPTEKTVLVPVYREEPLDDVLKEEEGVAYLRVKLGTNDSPEKIRETLTALSRKPANLTYVWTPDQGSRANYQERAALFGFIIGGFRVFGSRVGVSGGRSRGVDVKSAKPTRKK